MKDKSSLIPLKTIVISMGLLLIGGTIFLFSVIANKAHKEVSAPPVCEDMTVHLGEQGKLLSATTDGKTSQLTLSKDDKVTLLTIDNCSKTILHTLTIIP